MIAIDTNVLVYARRREMPLHEPALQALRELAAGPAAWGLPGFCIGEYLRVVTHPRLFDPPTSRAEALRSVDTLLESPSVRLLAPGPRYWLLLREAIEEARATGNAILDAQIVAVCMEHGATTILSEDRGFERFAAIKPRRLASA